jgi:putative membrane protein
MTDRFDPGLQPERTALAWRRTVLTLAVGSLASMRVLQPTLGGWSVAVGAAGLLAAGALHLGAARRRRQVDSILRTASPVLPGGGLLFALAGFTVLAGAIGLLSLLGVRLL